MASTATLPAAEIKLSQSEANHGTSMRQPPWGLRRKTALLSALVLLIVLALFAFQVLPLLRKTLEKSLQSQGKALAASIAQVVTSSILAEEYSGVVDHCLEVLKRVPTIRFIVVARHDGFCLLLQPNTWTQETLGKDWADPAEADVQGRFRQSPFTSELLYHQAHPLSYSGIEWGWLHLGLSIDAFDSDLGAIYRTLMQIGLFSILVGLGLSAYFASRLVRPISQLQAFAGRVAAGDLTPGPVVRTGDEVESLAMAFNTMIDALRHSQDELIAARDYADNIIRSMNDCLVVVTPDLRIRSVNAAAARRLGYSSEELMGRAVEQIFPAEVGAGRGIAWSEIRPKAGIVNQEYEMTARGGHRIPILFSASIMTDAAGNNFGYVTVAKDISDLKRSEEEKRSLELQIQQTQKLESLGVLAGGIAHDFNNLLMGILGNAEMLRCDLPAESPAAAGLQEVEIAALRAADLAKQLLAYAGKGRFLIQAFDVNDLIREMSQLLETSISRKITLELRFTEPLPAIRGDATQIRQVVMNLIINASDAIGDRSGLVVVRTGLQKVENEIWDDNYFLERISDGLYVFFEVEDNGCGMSEDTRQRIFDPFFTTKFTGRGLGLAATLGIIRSHKGAIAVKSVEGKGTTFRVLIPATEAVAAKPVVSPVSVAPAPVPAVAAVPQIPEPVQDAKGLILLADDEVAIRSLAVKMLKRCGYDLILATDGQEAVRLFEERQQDISLVVLDLTMPRMSGEEAFQAIRRLDPEVPVLISSGFDENETMARFVGAERVAYLQKPFLFRDFSARLDEMARPKQN